MIVARSMIRGIGAFGSFIVISGGGGRITPCLRHSALRAAALRDVLRRYAPPSNLLFGSHPPPLWRWRKILLLVEGGGFEPPKAEPSDLQSDPFGHSGTPPKKRRYSVVSGNHCQPSETGSRAGTPQDPRGDCGSIARFAISAGKRRTSLADFNGVAIRVG